MSNSTLNKLVFQEFEGETLTFEGLRLGAPVSFDLRDVHLTLTTVANQWGLFGRNSNITVRASQAVWLWPFGTGRWRLESSTMNEYDPRRFTGTLTFANAVWLHGLGEILERSNHVIEGTVRFGGGQPQLVMNDSVETRRIPVRIRKWAIPFSVLRVACHETGDR